MDSNNIKARKYFGIYGDNNLVLHHIDKSLKYCNPERYNEWRIEDLVILTRKEHLELHKNDWDYSGESNGMYGKKHSDETKEIIKEKRKLQKMNSWTPERRAKFMATRAKRVYGPISDETKKKMSEYRKGKHWKIIDGKRHYYKGEEE